MFCGGGNDGGGVGLVYGGGGGGGGGGGVGGSGGGVGGVGGSGGDGCSNSDLEELTGVWVVNLSKLVLKRSIK